MGMRSNPHILSTRVAAAQLEAIKLAASRRGLDIATFTRVALTRLTDGGSTDGGSTEALGLLEELIAALGLDPATASPDTVLKAITDMMANAPAPEGPAPGADEDPLQGGPDPAPPAKLSKEQAAACTRRGMPATPKGWAALTKRAVRSAGPAPAKPARPKAAPLTVATLSRDQWATLRKARMAPEEFVTRFNAINLKRASR